MLPEVNASLENIAAVVFKGSSSLSNSILLAKTTSFPVHLSPSTREFSVLSRPSSISRTQFAPNNNTAPLFLPRRAAQTITLASYTSRIFGGALAGDQNEMITGRPASAAHHSFVGSRIESPLKLLTLFSAHYTSRILSGDSSKFHTRGESGCFLEVIKRCQVVPSSCADPRAQAVVSIPNAPLSNTLLPQLASPRLYMTIYPLCGMTLFSRISNILGIGIFQF